MLMVIHFFDQCTMQPKPRLRVNRYWLIFSPFNLSFVRFLWHWNVMKRLKWACASAYLLQHSHLEIKLAYLQLIATFYPIRWTKAVSLQHRCLKLPKLRLFGPKAVCQRKAGFDHFERIAAKNDTLRSVIVWKIRTLRGKAKFIFKELNELKNNAEAQEAFPAYSHHSLYT